MWCHLRQEDLTILVKGHTSRARGRKGTTSVDHRPPASQSRQPSNQDHLADVPRQQDPAWQQATRDVEHQTLTARHVGGNPTTCSPLIGWRIAPLVGADWCAVTSLGVAAPDWLERVRSAPSETCIISRSGQPSSVGAESSQVEGRATSAPICE